MRIDRRYAGPPGTANGGVACGLLAAYVDAPVVEVTLRRPPPLDRDLRVVDGSAYDGEALVASAIASSFDVEPPRSVSIERAQATAVEYAGRTAHPFPGCFVCGIDREPPDALGLRPGPVGDGMVAAVWTPTADDPFLVWAALDCPGAWATDVPGRPMLLGRMALERHAPAAVGTPYAVVGQVLGTEGRKTFSVTALYDHCGEVVAVARQTWFTVELDQFPRR